MRPSRSRRCRLASESPSLPARLPASLPPHGPWLPWLPERGRGPTRRGPTRRWSKENASGRTGLDSAGQDRADTLWAGCCPASRPTPHATASGVPAGEPHRRRRAAAPTPKPAAATPHRRPGAGEYSPANAARPAAGAPGRRLVGGRGQGRVGLAAVLPRSESSLPVGARQAVLCGAETRSCQPLRPAVKETAAATAEGRRWSARKAMLPARRLRRCRPPLTDRLGGSRGGQMMGAAQARNFRRHRCGFAANNRSHLGAGKHGALALWQLLLMM